MSITTQLIKDEGKNVIAGRHIVYTCPALKLTVGYGRNLEDRGLSEAEAMYLLSNDIEDCREEVARTFPFFQHLTPARQDVLTMMCFNLGLNRLLGFKKMIRAIDDKDYREASVQMLDSDWAKQVGDRAIRLAKTMKEDI